MGHTDANSFHSLNATFSEPSQVAGRPGTLDD